MWCTVRPARRQVRTAVPDVAMAPETTVTVESGSTSASTWSSPTAIRQPPGGAAPATRTSPPRLTSTPQPAAVAARTAIRSAARAFAVAPRSSSTPIGTSTSRSAGFHRTRHHPGAGTAGACRFGDVRDDRGEVAVVAQGADGPAHRRVHEAVGQLGGTQRDGDRLGQQRADDDPAPGLLVHGGDLRVRGEPAARRVDRRQLVAQDVLGGGEPVRVGDDEPGGGAQRRVDHPLRGLLTDHDAPDDAWRRFGDGAATCGAWTGGDSFRWRLVDGATVGAGTSITGAGASSAGAGAGTTASAPPPSEPDDAASGSGAPAAAGGVEPANMTPKTTASAVPPAALHPVTCRARRWPASRRSWGCTGSRCAPGEVELIDGISLRLSGDARIGVPRRHREWPQVL